MFKNILKACLSAIVKKAVAYAEEVLSDADGAAKKEFAVSFVLNKLPIPSLLKEPLSNFLIEVIDEGVELAVEKLKSE